jgi:tryptophanyl-tRNA synthetase
LFGIYQAFANHHDIADIRKRYAEGIAWGEMKQILFEKINDEITPARERYEALLQAPEHIEQQLQLGAEKARDISKPFIRTLREAVGIAAIGHS